MDKKEQSHRHKSSRNGGARSAASRRGARGSKADPDALTVVEEFKSAAVEWATTLNIKPNKLFSLMPDHGRSIHWMRERYFGGVMPSPEDIEWVRLKSMSIDNMTGGILQEIRVYRYAIAEMCRVCTGSDDDEPPLCPDAICPLRGVSPLELSPDAWRKLPLSADSAE
jgi:hypothetical protein